MRSILLLSLLTSGQLLLGAEHICIVTIRICTVFSNSSNTLSNGKKIPETKTKNRLCTTNLILVLSVPACSILLTGSPPYQCRTVSQLRSCSLVALALTACSLKLVRRAALPYGWFWLQQQQN